MPNQNVSAMHRSYVRALSMFLRHINEIDWENCLMFLLSRKKWDIPLVRFCNSDWRIKFDPFFLWGPGKKIQQIISCKINLTWTEMQQYRTHILRTTVNSIVDVKVFSITSGRLCLIELPRTNSLKAIGLWTANDWYESHLNLVYSEIGLWTSTHLRILSRSRLLCYKQDAR